MPQRLIPGSGWIDDTSNNQRLIPGVGFVEEQGAADVIAPVLSAATGTATGATTATGTVTTDEGNGTLYRLASTNATETAATVVAASLSQAVTATGVQNVSFTGLTASTVYYAHYVQDDAALNRSARVSSASFTTTTPDVTAPTLSSGVGTVKSNALIVVGATTNEANGTMYVVVTTSATPPSVAQVKAGQNNAGTAAVFAANQAIGSTGAKTFNATDLTQLTGYYPYIVHTDAAGNDSDVLSIGLRTTFRNGATGQFIIDNTGPVGGNPAGAHFNKVVLPGDADKWFASREITPPATGTLTFNADGTYTFLGPSFTTTTRQLEVDGVDTPAATPFTISLYDSTPTVTGETSTIAPTVTNGVLTNGLIIAGEVSVLQPTVTDAVLSNTLMVQGETSVIAPGVTDATLSLAVLSTSPSAYAVRVTTLSDAILETFVKQPAEVQDYDFDFSEYLDALGDTIGSAVVEVAAGTTLLSAATIGKVVKVWLTAGTVSRKPKVTVRVTTVGGRVKEAEIYVRIKEV